MVIIEYSMTSHDSCTRPMGWPSCTASPGWRFGLTNHTSNSLTTCYIGIYPVDVGIKFASLLNISSMDVVT